MGYTREVLCIPLETSKTSIYWRLCKRRCSHSSSPAPAAIFWSGCPWHRNIKQCKGTQIREDGGNVSVVCVLRAVPGNASTRQLLVTQQYHNPDLSTQAKVLFGIKVIFPSLPPWLIKAPASKACLILSSSRKQICCPVKHASLPKCCTQTGTKGKRELQRLQRQESSPRGGKQHSWEEGGWLRHESTGPARWTPMRCVCCNPRFAAWLQATHFIWLGLPVPQKTSAAGGWEAALPLSYSLGDAASQPSLKAKSHQNISWEEPAPLAFTSFTA